MPYFKSYVYFLTSPLQHSKCYFSPHAIQFYILYYISSISSSNYNTHHTHILYNYKILINQCDISMNPLNKKYIFFLFLFFIINTELLFRGEKRFLQCTQYFIEMLRIEDSKRFSLNWSTFWNILLSSSLFFASFYYSEMFVSIIYKRSCWSWLFRLFVLIMFFNFWVWSSIWI